MQYHLNPKTGYYEFDNRSARMKRKLKHFWSSITDWCRENPETVTFIITALLAVSGYAMKAGVAHRRKLNIEKTQELKDLYIWDRSGGHYWKLKRPLTKDEWTYIHVRKSMNEPYYKILNELDVLD